MLLIKQICQTLRRPVFEVRQFPESELDYWACFFSIDANKDKPIKPDPTLTEAKSKLREMMR